MISGPEKITWRNSAWTVAIGFPVVVFLVFALLVLPHFDHSLALLQACRSNLDKLDRAKKNWATEAHKLDGDTATDADLFGTTKNLHEKPTCPAGGFYTLASVGEKPRCSIPGHTI